MSLDVLGHSISLEAYWEEGVRGGDCFQLPLSFLLISTVSCLSVELSLMVVMPKNFFPFWSQFAHFLFKKRSGQPALCPEAQKAVKSSALLYQNRIRKLLPMYAQAKISPLASCPQCRPPSLHSRADIHLAQSFKLWLAVRKYPWRSPSLQHAA